MNKEEELSKKMAEDWDERARKSLFHYISSSSHTIEEFFAIGEERAKKIIDPLLKQRASAHSLAMTVIVIY